MCEIVVYPGGGNVRNCSHLLHMVLGLCVLCVLGFCVLCVLCGVGLALADWIVRVLLTKGLEIGGPQGIVRVFSEKNLGHNA